MWVKIARFILRNRNVLLILLLLATAFMAYQATKIEMSYEHGRLIPSDDPDYIAYQEFKKIFGADGNVMVVGIQSDDIYDIEFFNDWYKLTQNVEELAGIENVISIANIPYLKKNQAKGKFDLLPTVAELPRSQAEVDSIKILIENNQLYDGLLYNKATETTLMAISLNQKVLDSEARVALVQEIQNVFDVFGANQNLEIFYSGLPYSRTIFATKVRNELIFFSVLAVLVTALLLWIFFRSFSAVIFPMLVVIIGAICSVGSVVVLGYKITILSGLIPPLIVVIGIPNCVYLLNKYHSEYKKHGNKVKALSRIIEKIGVATLITNTTTAIGFGVFAFTGSLLLKDFGIVASLNIMFVFVVSIIIIPSVYSILPPPKPKQTKHLENRYISKLLKYFESLVSNHRKKVFIVSSVLVLVSAYGLTRLESVGFILDDVPKNDKLYTDLLFFQEHFQGVMPLNVLIDTQKKGGAQRLSNLRKAEKVQALFEAKPYFSKPISIVELIKSANQAFYNNNPKQYRLPNSQESRFVMRYAARSAKNATDEISTNLTDSARRVIRISLNMADVGTKIMRASLDSIKPLVDSIYKNSDTKVTYTGKSLVFLKGNQYLIDSLIFSLILAFILISIIMSVLFRSLRVIFITFVTNSIPLLFTAAAMGFLGVYLKPSTVLIFSIAFGIAVDDSIHFLTKYRQELTRHSWDMKKTVLVALEETGNSMIYTSIILFFGFIIFAASNFQGTVALGILTSVTLIIAMLANLILLPSLILELDGKGKRQIGQRLKK